MIFITPAEFDKRMLEISRLPDPEAARQAAEDLMREVLCSLGYESGVRKFDERWWNRRDDT